MIRNSVVRGDVSSTPPDLGVVIRAHRSADWDSGEPSKKPLLPREPLRCQRAFGARLWMQSNPGSVPCLWSSFLFLAW